MASIWQLRGRCNAAQSPCARSLLALFGVVCTVSAQAENHDIRTRGNQWAPVVLFIEPGDTVTWLGMSGHETELIDGMGPEDAMTWRSELNDEGFMVTFVEPGAYIYKCHVHLNAGMIGAIVVGTDEPQNLAEIDQALTRLAEERTMVERIIGRMKRTLARR